VIRRLTRYEASSAFVVVVVANIVRFCCFTWFSMRLKMFGWYFWRQRNYLQMTPKILSLHTYFSLHWVAQYTLRSYFILSISTREAKINIASVVLSYRFSAFRCISITGNWTASCWKCICSRYVLCGYMLLYYYLFFVFQLFVDFVAICLIVY
jgi:hypothetical protein